MAGIYIHIPFCRKACHYCNFHFSTTLDHQDRMVDAIRKEISLIHENDHEKIDTIYFGGGTPSLLSPNHIDSILKTIQSTFNVSLEAEITLEANPDDINKSSASAWKKMGINRFSIGIQSFHQEDLEWMNRAHDANASKNAIETILKEGFDNFSIDLIYGSPGQTLAHWEENLNTAISYKVPHLSCYALTVEEGTALHHHIRKQLKADVDTVHQSKCFELLMQKTQVAGYRHYEISNFALPGMESKHNSSYWDRSKYFGFGPAAHSYNGTKRRWNIANNIQYIKMIEANETYFEEEILSHLDQLNEYIMTGLRTDKGISRKYIVENWGESILNKLNSDIYQWIASGKVSVEGESWLITKEGKFFADGIASSLFQLD